METLVMQSAVAQWSAEDAIDWRTPIKVPRWIRRKAYTKMVSQLYHGELATQRLCRQLVDQSDDAEVRAFAAWQLADEIRHASVYRRYLERVGGVAAIEPALESALERSFDVPGSDLGLIIAFHVVFEGGALHVIDRLSRQFPCPLFRQIASLVLPDEARHVAFGTKYLRARIGGLTAGERSDIYHWVETLWHDCHRAASRRHSWPGALATGIGADWVAAGWDARARLLREIGLCGPSAADGTLR